MSNALSETAAHLWRPQDTFGARLRLVRHELKLTVEEAAALCGIPHPTWSTWENGVRPRDKVEIVSKVVHGLSTPDNRLDGDWLLKGGDLTPPSTKWSTEDDETAGQTPLGLVGQGRFRF